VYQPKTAEEGVLVDQLRTEVLTMPVPAKPTMPRWFLELEAR
jgi:hypothetical protein